MTYGSQQAVTAKALSELLRSDRPVVGGDAVAVVWLRDQLRLALIERLQIIRGRYTPVRSVDPQLDQIANNAHDLLPAIVATTPARGWVASSAGESNLPVLSHPTPDAIVEAWRRAAASMTVANHDLDQGHDQPWFRSHGPHWQLIEDAATVTEAFVVLDDRLDALGALCEHSSAGRPFTLRGARTLTSSIAREAAWGADACADLLSARSSRGPVRVIRTADDLIGAHQRLATMLEPSRAVAGVYRQPIDVRQARVVALAQAEENRLLSLAAANLGDDRLAANFQRRAEVYVAFLSASQRARPLRPTPDLRALEYQQHESLRGTRQLAPSDIDHSHLAQLDAVHHATARALGRALRVDLSRGSSSNPVTRSMCNVVVRNRGEANAWGMPSRSGPYGRAVLGLASQQTCPEHDSVAARPRAELRAVLAATPSHVAWRRPSFQQRAL